MIASTLSIRRAALLLFAASAALAATASTPTVGYAQWWKDVDGCLVSEHRGNSGARLIVDATQTYSYVGGRWNDRISSVTCEVFCRLTVWEHRDYQGASRTFESTSYVGGGWNDKISSMEASCDS